MADAACFSLDKLSIKKLKALAGRNGVSLRGKTPRTAIAMMMICFYPSANRPRLPPR